MTSRRRLVLAGIVGAVGIALGAFGAHALPSILSEADLSDAELAERAAWFETGARYHMYHGLALLALAAIRTWTTPFTISAYAWLIGIVIFSGCLYTMALSGMRILGAVVPLGGVAFIVGWIAIAVGAQRTDFAT